MLISENLEITEFYSSGSKSIGSISGIGIGGKGWFQDALDTGFPPARVGLRPRLGRGDWTCSPASGSLQPPHYPLPSLLHLSLDWAPNKWGVRVTSKAQRRGWSKFSHWPQPQTPGSMQYSREKRHRPLAGKKLKWDSFTHATNVCWVPTKLCLRYRWIR